MILVLNAYHVSINRWVNKALNIANFSQEKMCGILCVKNCKFITKIHITGHWLNRRKARIDLRCSREIDKEMNKNLMTYHVTIETKKQLLFTFSVYSPIVCWYDFVGDGYFMPIRSNVNFFLSMVDRYFYWCSNMKWKLPFELLMSKPDIGSIYVVSYVCLIIGW